LIISRGAIKKKGTDSLAGSIRTRGFKLKEGIFRLIPLVLIEPAKESVPFFFIATLEIIKG